MLDLVSKNINSKYSHSTLSKFDIIGSYFVNLYYNEFYTKARNLKMQSTYNNITEAYKNILSSYVEFSTKQDFFKQIVKGIHTYCISTTRYTTMSHKECIDFMVSEFVPNNLWNSLRENQKNKLFHESLINCIKVFTEKIISNHLHIIIDNHNQVENIPILQDLFLTIILLEKDKNFSKFINPNSNPNLDIFKDKLQKIIIEKKKMKEEKTILTNTIENLTNKIKVLNGLNNKNSTILVELQKQNKLLIESLKQLKIENYKLKENIKNNNTNNSNKEKQTIIDKSNTLIDKSNTLIDKSNNKIESENKTIEKDINNFEIKSEVGSENSFDNLEIKSENDFTYGELVFDNNNLDDIEY